MIHITVILLKAFGDPFPPLMEESAFVMLLHTPFPFNLSLVCKYDGFVRLIIV